MSRIDNLERYIEAYTALHGTPPVMNLMADDIVCIGHPESVIPVDHFVTAHILADLPAWTQSLLTQAKEKDFSALVYRMAPVNIREVYAYELSALEGSERDVA